MKTTTSLLLILISGLVALLISGCGTGKPEIVKVDPAFGEYVSAYTSGMVSRRSPIRIELTDEVASALNKHLKDSTDLEDLFEIEPAIKGHVVRSENHVIEFVPDEVLPVDQFYDVHFDLEEIAEVKSGFEDFHFQFATYRQELFVTVDGLYDYDEYNLEWRELRGSLLTSDYEDTTLLRKTLTVTQHGKNLPIRLEKSYEEHKWFFYVDSIERREQKGEVIVSWDGRAISSIKKGRKTIEVPALGDFSVSTARVIDNEDQSVELQFSEPIAQQQLDGMITIDGLETAAGSHGVKLTFAISYNTVTIYLPNRTIGNKKLEVRAGIHNIKGHAMAKGYSEDLEFNEPKPLVRIRGNGSVLPNSQGLIFPFEAISLKSVDVRIVKIYENNIHHFLQVNNLDGDDGLTRFGKVIVRKKIRLDYDKTMDLKQWNNHVVDLNKLIQADPGAIYRISIKFGLEDAICDCPVVDENNEDDEGESEEDWQSEEPKDPDWSEDNWHGYGFDDGFDNWSYYSDSYTACQSDYYDGKAVSRNILASDLGVVFKLDQDKNGHAFVSNMLTTEPAANVQIDYFDFTKQLITSGTTDDNGMLDVKLSRKPFLMIAKLGKQRGYLKLGDGYSNSLSKFDIEGEQVQNGVKGFIYGERGVWRPGDSLYLTFILQDLHHKLPEGHPVKFELQDPNGQVVYETSKSKHVGGMYDFRTMTGTEAPTGNYTAYIKVGNRTFSKNLLVETVKPNRLKIYMGIDEKHADDSLAQLQVKWLHGAVAKKLKANVRVSVNETRTVFDKFKSFVFDSPIRSYSSDQEAVFDGYLDDHGLASVRTKLQVGNAAPGKLRATYITKVFEKGGDFSIDRKSVTYSPFKTYVGLETPRADNADQTLETGKTHKLNIVTVNENGALTGTSKLQVKVYKVQWRWWYEKDDENLADYIARSGTIIVKDTTISAEDGKAVFNFRVNYPEYGRYLVTVTDLEGKHQTGKTVTVDWPYWSRGNRSDNENARMLNFACDKMTYNKGELIKLSFPSPSDGRALVTVETSRKVVKKFWIKTVKGETTHSFQATDDMAPNAFVHVTLIQPHATTKNDLPIRMYGIVPVMVDDPATHLKPEIRMPDEVRPESTTSIQVKEQNGRKMTYTLAVVDEGLLDLTNFRTPEPWTTFYAREALGVTTWDIYDHVIGAYAGKLDKLLSIGGDGGLEEGEGAKANRFKPVVMYLGPFTLEAGQTRSHKVTLPNYVGAVRVMVVAENEKAYGNAEKSVLVKKPLMVLATLPRVLGPGEQVQLPVNVFAMEKNIKNVKVTIETNELLNVEGGKTQTITFAEPGDDVINFKLNVPNRIGIAKVKVTATCGKETATEEIELDVRTPNPVMTEGTEIALEPGKEWTVNIDFKGLIGTNKATIECSNMPSISLEKRMDELIQYPHGCIEQTTSSVFPQLYVDNVMQLDEKQRNRTSENVKAGLKRLQLFQTGNGGFAYWPGESDDSEWGSNYAGHFMLEAEQQGYTVSGNLKTRWLKYQQNRARNWSSSNNPYTHPHGSESNQLIQAYRLFVLALSKNPELGAMNRLREDQHLSDAAKWRLSAAYELAGQEDVARKLVKDLATTVKDYRELSYSYGSDTRDEAMILETLSLLKNQGKATAVAKEVSKKLSSDTWMSTQETAYSLLAMCEFAGVKGRNGTLKYSYQLNEANVKNGTSEKHIQQLVYTDKDFKDKAKMKFKNTGKTTLYIKLMVSGKPLVGDKSNAAKDLSLKLKFLDMDGKTIQPDKLAQGMDFIAEVTITNPGKKGIYKEMALTQILPSGWEIHNTRMDGNGASEAARYQDIRDDRVYSYYELAPGATKTFRVQLNATYLGRFYMPTTYSEAMYDHLINARVPGQWVEVVGQK